MKEKRLFSMFIVALFAVAGVTTLARAASTEELVAAAKKEGALNFYFPGNLTPNGAKLLSEAFKKKYGLPNIRTNYSPSGGISRDVGMLISKAATGMAPEWDVMTIPDTFTGRLFGRKMLVPFDYANIGVDPEAVHYNKHGVAIYTAFALPAYNKKLVAAKDAPKKWEDILDPKWKGKKIGQSTLTHHYARLAVTDWGEERTLKFVEALSKQDLILGRVAEIYSRLELGEVQIAATLTDTHIHRAKVTGAPLVFAKGPSPTVGYTVQASVLKGARHPNIGHLFISFLTTIEAQRILEKDVGHSLHLIPGTGAYNYVKNNKVVFMTDKDARTVGKLQREYGQVLGFKRRRRGKKGKK